VRIWPSGSAACFGMLDIRTSLGDVDARIPVTVFLNQQAARSSMSKCPMS
jgi:hypothetical protein